MIPHPPSSTLFPYTTLFRSAMRADVVKRPHLGVIATHHDQRDAGRMREQAIVEGLGQLRLVAGNDPRGPEQLLLLLPEDRLVDRKSTRLNSSHTVISYAVFC